MRGTVELDQRLAGLAEELNHALIAELVRSGELTTPGWRVAFEAAPRHLFVPRFSLPDNLGGGAFDATGPEQRERWLRAAYHNEALLTAFDEHGLPTSSCSAPSVVAIMLEASQATDGDRVLEIGTGTGWTAGLLSKRLGSGAVTSVDNNPECVSQARERLDSLGLTPRLAVADGYLGYEPCAPYDRIIATAALRQVPPAWLGQVRPGGTILTDLRGSYAGNLARFTVHGDGSAAGRFLPSGVGFMPLRSTQHPFSTGPAGAAVTAAGETRTTGPDPAVLHDPGFAFFAQLNMPGTATGQMRLAGQDPWYLVLTDADSEAWARVEAGDGPHRAVTQGGGRRLWDELEAAHELWRHLRQPQPENFTITLTPDGEQIVALPDSGRSWALPL